LDLAISKYTQYVERFIKYIEDIIEIEISVFDFTEVTNNLGLLKKTFEKNILSLQKKRTQKSKSVELESLHKVFDLITSQISECSTEIESHNSRCQNIEDERRKLTSQVWRFIASETKSTIDEYIKAKEKYESGIQSQDTKKNKTNLEISALNREITTIQSEITSVAHSINEINRILMGFHFEGFYLSESTRKGHYELIRKDGTSATNTLSEGEYTFITFLYFYYLIRGSSEKEQLEQKKIVVIDDPISSLDSSVLFIVSNLVKALIDELNDNYRGSKIRQLFVLTHNIYFHKEISFKGSRGNITRNELFWLVYKKEEISEIKTSTKNPINTTYALLWDEIKNSESTNRITVFNNLRRILEYYFKIIGNYDYEAIINHFDFEDKQTCKALISWINDGSHFINDDLLVETEIESVDRYLKVFKDIFEKLGHLSHYNMMMNRN
jgi:wobble nucleotide-excising tRNase